MKKSGKKMIMAGFVTVGSGGVSHRWNWLAFSPALIIERLERTSLASHFYFRICCFVLGENILNGTKMEQMALL
ncbi:MAG: hypothetical protein ACOY32_09325 [Thermodesulfobacteriota bacterium]